MKETKEVPKLPPKLEGKRSVRLVPSRPRGKSRRRGRTMRTPHLPPELESVTVVPQVIRYVVQASPGASITINSAQFQASLGGIVTTAATTMTAWMSSFRLSKIVIWPAASSSGSTIVGPEVVWVDSANSDLQRDESKIRTLPAGITGKSAGLLFRPPPRTVASLWHHYDGSSHNMLTFTNLVQGTIIDVHTVGTLGNNLSTLTLTISASALGAVGWPYLDSSAAKLLPVGKPLIS